jgi:hypothetical protein
MNLFVLGLCFRRDERIAPFGKRFSRSLPERISALGFLIDIFNTCLDAPDEFDQVMSF